MRHLDDTWVNAAKADKENNELRSELAHGLIEDLGMHARYETSNGKTLILTDEKGVPVGLAVKGGKVMSTNTWRLADIEHGAKVLGAEKLDPEAWETLRSALIAAAQSPTPELEHQRQLMEVADKYHRVYHPGHDRLSEARQMLDIYDGQVEAPSRGPMAKKFKQFQELSEKLASEKLKVEKKQAELDEFDRETRVLTERTPYIADLLAKQREELTHSIQYDSRLQSMAQKELDAMRDREQYYLEEEIRYKENRAAVDAELAELKAAFEAQQGEDA